MSSERGAAPDATGRLSKACPSCAARYPVDALFCALDGAPLTTSPSVIAAAAETDPYVGREILGHIEIRQLVGIGAMGRVYRAFQRGIDRDVAVKILHRELSSNQTLVARFEREAKVASRLAHPNVVHVLLVGQLPDGAMYIVMEYLDGLSLQSALAGVDGALPLPRALHIALQLCDAAGEGHGQGIIHRDLKPENVMLVRRADDPDFVKVLDFGIARVQLGDQSIATAAGLIFGTARYISPEGAQGEKVGPQGDVYAIATIVYQMLAGRTPFQGEQAVGILISQIHDPPPQLTELARAAYVPAPIAAVVMQNLSKRPEERAGSGRALGRALLDAAVGSGLSAHDLLARPSMLGGSRGMHPSSVQLPALQRTRQLTLDPETAARMGSRTTFETPVPAAVAGMPSNEGDGRVPVRTEIADGPQGTPLPPGVATTRWIPPDGFATRLLTASTPVPAPTLGPRPSSGVEATMDDQHSVSSRTLATPTIVPAGGRETPGTAPPTSRAGGTAAPVSRPPPGVDTTLAGDEMNLGRAASPAGQSKRASRTRSLAVVASCAVVGGLALGITGWRAGFFAPAASAAREQAGVGPVSPSEGPAIGGGSTPSAPAEADRPSALPALEPLARAASAPSKGAIAGASGGRTTAPSGATSPQGPAAAGWRVVVDAVGKPGIGQPIDFTARIDGAAGSRAHPRIDDGRFLIAGPGIAGGTEVPAPDDGSGTFRTTFTFLQSGRFEVAFTGHADGSPVRGGRPVVVGDTTGETSAPPRIPPGPVTEAPPAAPTSASAGGKWL